ncbi:LANO_0D08174g1_1 [Lachancea nothofagi CBS 11611]|uniref:tRNA wybutosine-synthesizing protein 3 n=1 Tax=Lachancea nothofagi CBS 11611 TaxID=1266666 RepID=A0A1G4JIV9_9SACH|nr:LANO_0D08174g1_1 [Lachancea nothofagi CBS 11611]
MSQNAFDQKKEHILAEIQSASLDLSPKGTIDELCVPIMKLINSHKDMVTTSSCSGRLSVFVEGNKLHNDGLKSGGKGEGGKWLFVTHDRDQVRNWDHRITEPVVYNTDLGGAPLDSSTRYILYKYEPFILHVKCRDFQSASKLFNTAMSCGFRESGIGSNNIVALRVNIKLDVPIGFMDDSTGQLVFFVTQNYINIINEMTLTKYTENSKKMQELYEKIELQIVTSKEPASDKQVETKEERRVRKRKEGLLRKEAGSQQKAT